MTKRNEQMHLDTRLVTVGVITRTCFAGLGTTILLFVAASGLPAVTARADTAQAAAPDMSIGAQQFPGEDAINLRWEQHWTLEQDGTVRRREHRWIKLLNSRPIRRLADPRVDFHAGQDKLIIHTAQTHLPGGKIMPVPDYSFNLAAPDDVGGWPQYALWQQQVICFSGIKDNVVLELDYEVVTQPHVLPWIDADLRLDDDYPTVERRISVTVPKGTVLNHRLDGISPEMGKDLDQSSRGKMTTFSWMFRNLPGTPAEPQSSPWRQRCPRLQFTTCTNARQWVPAILSRVRQAAEPNEQIKKLAETVVEDEADPTERIRKIARKLHDSFKFLNSPKTFRSLECRPAGEVLEANYGNPLESAALCAALLRALDFDVSVEVSVVALAWEGKVPTNSAFDGVVVVANLPDGPVHVHPQHGVFRNPGSLGKHWLLSLNESGTLRSTYVHARGEKEPSRINITGKVTIDSEGNAAGDLHIRLTGAFYDPAQLETADQQKKLVGNMLGRVLDGFEVSKHSIAMLSDEVLRATVTVASKDTLKSYGKGHLLTLGSGPALLNEFPLPLKRSYRKTAVHLPGQARESVALTIELPEEWSAMIAPTALAPVTGSWGTVSQQVETDGGEVRFRRTVEITADTIPPDDFAALREAINHLRTTGSLHLVCGKSVPQP